MNAERHPARVVLTARAASDAVRLLREAGDLARARRAELAGVFVEESDLLRLAELPMTREVGFTSGTVRAIDLEPTLRQLQRQAAEVQRLIAQAAAGLDVPWSFRVARGSVVEVAVAAVAETDVVLLAPPALTHALARPAGRPATTIGAFHDGGPAGDRALARALELAGLDPGQVSLVIPDGADPLPIRRHAADQLGLRGSLPDAVAVSRLRPGRRALVVSVGSALGTAAMRRMLAAAGCPLVLVG